MSDPYTRQAEARPAPASWRARLRYLGPSVIVAGAIVGSGEIILTSSLGALAGFTLLWWVLFSCWLKSLVQAELARYIITTGDTYLRAINRIPGRVWGPRGDVAWPLWFGLAAIFPALFGVAGILGGAGQALTLLLPAMDSGAATVLVGLVGSGILVFGGYRGLEKVMIFLVFTFTLTTLVSAFAMQGTQYAVSFSDVISGLTFDMPAEFWLLALAVYGFTGVNSGETISYTYWCVEKGYPGYIGERDGSAEWLDRARGWIRVVHTDVWLTLLILTCATLPFYLLGAGVLHRLGVEPEGVGTLSALAGMFTATLGSWALWLFGIGAFFILFSTTLASIGGSGRLVPDYLVEMGFLDREDLAGRLTFTRWYVGIVPIFGTIAYLMVQDPVALVSVGGITGALLLPLQSGLTLYLHRHFLPIELRPAKAVSGALMLIFLVQTGLAGFALYLVARPWLTGA